MSELPKDLLIAKLESILEQHRIICMKGRDLCFQNHLLRAENEMLKELVEEFYLDEGGSTPL